MTSPQAQLDPAWRLVATARRCAGPTELLVVAPAARGIAGALTCGASRSAGFDPAASVRTRRVLYAHGLLPRAPSPMRDAALARLVSVAMRHPAEQELLVTPHDVRAQRFRPLRHAPAAAAAAAPLPPLVPLGAALQLDGDCTVPRPSSIVVTGGAGALGCRLVRWLIDTQRVAPERIVVVARALPLRSSSASPMPATPLEPTPPRVRIVRVTSIDDELALRTALGDACRGEVVPLIFHLAGSSVEVGENERGGSALGALEVGTDEGASLAIVSSCERVPCVLHGVLLRTIASPPVALFYALRRVLRGIDYGVGTHGLVIIARGITRPGQAVAACRRRACQGRGLALRRTRLLLRQSF